MKLSKTFTPMMLLMVVVTLFFFSSLNAQTGWQRLNDYRPYGYNDAQFASANVAYMCGNFNGVAKSTDGGLNWTWKTFAVNYHIGFSGLQFINENEGIMFGEYIGVYKTLDGGETWSKIFDADEFSNYVADAHFINISVGYVAVKNSKKIYKTTNGGTTWADIYTSPDPLLKIYFQNELTGFRAGNYKLARTTNGGTTWDSLAAFTAVKSINKFGDNSLLVLSESGLHKTSNLGNTWQNLLITNSSPYSVSFTDINNIAVTAYGSKAYITNNSGANWVEKSMPGNGIAFASTSGNTVYKGDGLYKVENNFNDFTDVFRNKLTENLIDASMFSESNFYILGDSSIIAKTSDGGVNITKQRLDFPARSMSFLNPSTGYCTYKNKLLKTLNGGTSWDTLYKFTGNFPSSYMEMTQLNFVNENLGYLVFLENTFGNYYTKNYITTDAGVTWNVMGNGGYQGTSTSWSSRKETDFKIFPSGIGYKWMTSAYGSMNITHQGLYIPMKTTDYGANWFSIQLDSVLISLNNLQFLNENTGYMVRGNSTAFKTVNGGASWSPMNIPNSTGKLYMIDETNGYAIKGFEFYRTFDGGTTWALQQTDINSSTGYNIISFINPQTGIIIGRGGLVLKTTSGGSVGITGNSSTVADGYSLSQNYPNPFNPETKIQFSLPKNGLVKIAVYDMLGREVKELVNEFKLQGVYTVTMNGASLSSGIYFYKLITNDFVETKKMILVK